MAFYLRAGQGRAGHHRAGQCTAWVGQGRSTARQGQVQRQIQRRAVRGRSSGISSSRDKDRGSDRVAARAGQEQDRDRVGHGRARQSRAAE